MVRQSTQESSCIHSGVTHEDFSTSLALNLTRRSGGVYYYRQPIPRQISSHYKNRKEICFSLNTKEPYEANQLSCAYSLKYSQEFEGHMKGMTAGSLNYCCEAGIRSEMREVGK